MRGRRPEKLTIARRDQDAVHSAANSGCLPWFQVQRAKIVLLAAEGLENDEIARRLDTRRKVVWLWRKRFLEKRLEGLDELPRPGRPRAFSPRGGRSGKGPGV